MTRYLQSGLRRDVCAVVYDLSGATGQQVKTELERDYDDRIEPRTFYGALDALVETGHLTVEEDGLQDRYALTEGGERALLAYHEWLAGRVEGSDETTSGAGGPAEDTGDPPE